MGQYHILIVEDDREILDGVGIYLKNQGYEVFKAQNGREGLQILEQQKIHLAIGKRMIFRSLCSRQNPRRSIK